MAFVEMSFYDCPKCHCSSDVHCGHCGAPLLVEEKFTSTNTGSPKLPLLSSVESYVKAVCSCDDSINKGDLITGVQFAYDFIERQLRASA